MLEGWCYTYGSGVAKDLSTAVRLYRLAADQGYAHARCNLGECRFHAFYLLMFFYHEGCLLQVMIMQTALESSRMRSKLLSSTNRLQIRATLGLFALWVSFYFFLYLIF